MAGASLLILMLCLLAGGRDSGYRDAAFLGLAVLGGLLAFGSLAPSVAVNPLVTAVLAGGAGWSVWRLGSRVGSIRSLASAVAVAAGIVSLYAIYQRSLGLDRLAARLAEQPGLPDRADILGRLATGRAFAGFATPAALGGFLALAIPATLGLAWGSRGRPRLLWGCLLALEFGGLASAASATAVMALMVAGALAVVALRPGRRGILLGLATLALLTTVVLGVRGGELLSASHENNPWRLRAGNFRVAVEMISDRPWLGTGPGGFADAFPAYRRQGDNETRHVHNLPLEVAAETGLPAGLLLSGLFAVLFVGPALSRPRQASPWGFGLAVGLAGFAAHNLADFTAFLPSVLWTAALIRGRLGTERPVDPGAADRRDGRVVALQALVVGVALVGVASGISEDRRFESRVTAWRGEPAAAERASRSAVRWAPWSADAALMLARAAASHPPLASASPERREVALELADRAVELAPGRAGARATRAEARVAVGDLAGALADLEQAILLRPRHLPYRRDRSIVESALTDGVVRR